MYLILIVALLLLGGLLYSAKKESVNGQLVTKPFLSLLFIIVALIQPYQSPLYFYLILSGLCLCLVGDVCLIFFSSKKLFKVGLVSFLAGHVMYVFAFISFGVTGAFLWGAAVISLALSTTVFIWLRPHLGDMLGPVVVYVIIITAMVISAASLMSNAGLDMTGRLLVFVGALLFYFSDIFVARQRFVKKEFLNRAAGLPLYYTGQFMIAFSIGMIG